MSDQDQPKQPKKGQFQPGHKLSKGRQPGAIGKKNIREQALTGLTRAGVNIARKNGTNTKVSDGLAEFFRDLAEKNSSAAAALAGRLIGSEPEQKTDAAGYTMPIIVNTVVSGNQFAPGKTVLLPFDQCEEAWRAYRDGAEAWRAFLLKIEPTLTRAAFEALSLVEPPIVDADVNNVDDTRRDNVTPLRLIEGSIETPESQQLSALEQKLLKMDHAQLLELAKAFNVGE